MPRKEEPWTIKRRRGFWYYKLRGDNGYHSTGLCVDNWKQTKSKAERYAQEQAGAGAFVQKKLGWPWK